MNRIKRLAVTMALAVLSSAMLFASGKWKTVDMKVESIGSLEISSIFEVVFEKSNDCRIVMKLPDDYDKYLQFSASNGKVVLGMDSKKITRKAKKIFKKDAPVVKIYAPSFNRLKLSGTVKMKLIGDISVNDLSIDLSEASELEGGNLRAENIETEISGAADFTDVKITARRMKLEASGASFSKFALMVDDMDAEVSDAADVVFESADNYSGKTMKIDVSGSGNLKAVDYAVENVEADLSGASDAVIRPLKILDVKTSGSSSLRYKKSPNLSVRNLDISSASSVKSI